MSHTLKNLVRAEEAQLRKCVKCNMVSTNKEHYTCRTCFENIDGEEQKRSEGVSLCLCIFRESIQWSPEGGIVVIREEDLRGNYTSIDTYGIDMYGGQ